MLVFVVYVCASLRVVCSSWFAWANSLFGELIVQLAKTHPHLIFDKSDNHNHMMHIQA